MVDEGMDAAQTFFALGRGEQTPGPRWEAWWRCALRGDAAPVCEATPWLEDEGRTLRLAAELGRRAPSYNERVARSLAGVPAAEPALLRALDVADGAWEALVSGPPWRLSRFLLLASCSDCYGRWLSGNEAALLEPAATRSRASASVEACLRSEDRSEGARAGFARALRERKKAEVVEILLLELTQREEVVQTAARISAVAEAAIGDALRWAIEEHGAEGMGCAVIGMGKLGARELNLSSDVDLVHVYERETAEDGSDERAVQVARTVNRLIEERTQDGLVFRVDVRLRPFGTRGALSVRRDRAIAYYEAFGRTWERGAWIKAREVASEGETGARLIRALRPFVYRRSLDESAIGEVAAMKTAIDAEQRRREGVGAGARGFDVKLGRGGIREIEFFVQAFSLVWGGREPTLAVAPTVVALERLSEAGLVPERERSALASAYRFLRTLEHRVQMQEEQQTHVVPSGGEAGRRVALRMGFVSEEGLMREVERHRGHVSRAFRRLFGGAGRVVGSEVAWLAVATSAEATRAEREVALADAGFAMPGRWVDVLERFASPPHPLLGVHAEESRRAAAEGLMQACADAADPDRALERTSEVLLQRAGRESLLRIASASERSRAVLVGLFGWSDHLGRILARDAALLEGLLTDVVTPAASREGLEERLERALAQEDARAPGAMRERRLHRLRRFRHGEEIRVALAEIGGRVDPWEAMADLTALARAMVRACHREAAADRPMGEGEAERVGAIAFGKLAGGEMGHASDLDLVFVVDGGVERIDMASRFARRWISFLSAPMVHGRLYPVDTRLRPDGGQGMVITSVEGFLRYYRERAWAWEKLALVRSEPIVGTVVGDGALDASVEAVIDGVDPEVLRGELGRIRGRRVSEPGAKQSYKARAGGLADVELLLGVLQVDARSSGQWRGGRTAGARETLRRLVGCGAVAERDASTIEGALTYFRQVEMWLRLVDGEAAGPIPSSDRVAAAILSRVAGRDGGREALEATTEGWAEEVRSVLRRCGLVDVPG